MYRGTKQNCCKYLRLLPSRILIGSTCIIHSLVHWSLGDFWFIEKKEEKERQRERGDRGKKIEKRGKRERKRVKRERKREREKCERDI